MIAGVQMKFDASKPAPPAWEGEIAQDGSTFNPEYERYLIHIIENYPESVTVEVSELTFEDVLRWARSARDFEFDHDLARDLIAFLIGVQR